MLGDSVNNLSMMCLLSRPGHDHVQCSVGIAVNSDVIKPFPDVQEIVRMFNGKQ